MHVPENGTGFRSRTCAKRNAAVSSAAAAFFFSIWRLISRARAESFSVFALSRNASSPPTMVDRLHRVGRDAQAHRAAKRVGDHRHILQVRQKAALGLDVGVAHLVANLRALAVRSQRRDMSISFARKIAPKLATRSRLQAWSVVHFQEPRTYKGLPAERQAAAELAKTSAKIPQKIRFFSLLNGCQWSAGVHIFDAIGA